MNAFTILSASLHRHSIALILMIATVMACSSALAAPAAKNPDLDPQKRTKLESTVMNQNLTLEKRIRALKELYSDRTVNGRIERTICAWDPLGKPGPIAAATNDQILRSMHYGMKLDIVIFQNEKALISTFLNEKKCDAILVRGAATKPFNKFSATIEALGALPERRHLQLLMQVLANPSMGKRLTNDNYTIMGVATIGDSYVFMEDKSVNSLLSMPGKNIAVQYTDLGMIELIKAVGATPVEGDMMESVQTFADKKVPSMISPAIGYLVMGAGQMNQDVGAITTPIAQSTMQLIGRTEQFPPELAQILREDFLFKFDNYARRVDKEVALVEDSFWITPQEEDKVKLADVYQGVRIKLRDQGFYDASMLRLARKIRCRFEPTNQECTNPVE
jgi:hypothetical protein